MRFMTEESVKKWMRGLPLLKKELEMKIVFYTELIRDMKKLGEVGEKHCRGYLDQIERLQEEIQRLAKDMDRLLDKLDPDEKAVLTARYVRRLLWDAMEFHVYFSRRQAIRIHNRAVKKLVGESVGGEEDGE